MLHRLVRHNTHSNRCSQQQWGVHFSTFRVEILEVLRVLVVFQGSILLISVAPVVCDEPRILLVYEGRGSNPGGEVPFSHRGTHERVS